MLERSLVLPGRLMVAWFVNKLASPFLFEHQSGEEEVLPPIPLVEPLAPTLTLWTQHLGNPEAYLPQKRCLPHVSAIHPTRSLVPSIIPDAPLEGLSLTSLTTLV